MTSEGKGIHADKGYHHKLERSKCSKPLHNEPFSQTHESKDFVTKKFPLIRTITSYENTLLIPPQKKPQTQIFPFKASLVVTRRFPYILTILERRSLRDTNKTF